MSVKDPLTFILTNFTYLWGSVEHQNLFLLSVEHNKSASKNLADKVREMC